MSGLYGFEAFKRFSGTEGSVLNLPCQPVVETLDNLWSGEGMAKGWRYCL